MGNTPATYTCRNAAQANLQQGDIIKINRSTRGLRAFYHFAVYIGEGHVVHLTKSKLTEYCKCPWNIKFAENNTETECKRCGKDYRFVIVSEPLEYVLNDSEFSIDNNLDNDISPRDDIVERATCLLGPIRYSVFRYNCEHFANWCRYNTPISKQSSIKWFNPSNYEEKLKQLENSFIQGIIKAKNLIVHGKTQTAITPQ